MSATRKLRPAVSRLPVRTKPQAPRPLRYWPPSSFWAGIRCVSQGGVCDPLTQTDAGGTPAPQLLRFHHPPLSAFCGGVRPPLRQVTGQAWTGASAQLSGLSAQAAQAGPRDSGEPRVSAAVLLRAHAAPARVSRVYSLSESAAKITAHPEQGRNRAPDQRQP